MSARHLRRRGFAGTSPPFVLVNIGMFWLSTAIAATALWPIYRSTAVIVLVAVALVVGTVIALAGTYFRWPSPVMMLATIASFLVIGVPLAVPAETQYGVLPTLEGVLDLVAGVALGWKQLLTITLPVGQYQALLVPALVLILVSTVVGMSIALRSRRGELAVILPVLVLLVATAFGPKFPNRPLVAPVALLAVVLLWLVWFRWHRRRVAVRSLLSLSTESPSSERTPESGFAGLRTALSAAAIVALASTAAVGAVAAVPPSADRTVLRTVVAQPFDPRDYVSPLSGFRSYWQAPKADSILFEITGLADGGRVRLATLDTYNGVVYSVGSDRVTSQSGSFTRVPSTFDQSSVRGTPTTVNVTIGDYSGVWMPTVGKFESVDFTSPDSASLRDNFYYNDVSGSAAVLGGLSSGDSFALTAVVPAQPTERELASLNPGSASVPTPRDVPDELTASLEQYTAGVSGAGNRLVAALAGLKSDGYISHGIDPGLPPSRSGHAADRISQLFTDPRMIGDAEQYAVAAALMAEDIGFPARVVVGFVPQGTDVTGADVSAWIEINTTQFGWVTVDPNPPLRDIPQELPQENSQIARPQTIVPPPVVESDNIDRQITPDTEQQRTPDVNLALQAVLAILGVLGWVVLAAAIVLAPFLVIVAAKLRRRRIRRRASTPLQRITGGWQEFENAVVDHGLVPMASSTRTEFAMVAGGVQSEVLAAIADRASFAPDAPSESDADNVWRAVDELQVSLDDGLTGWQRLKAKISVASLGGYSVVKLFTR